MELITLYNRVHKKDRLHIITMESILNEALQTYLFPITDFVKYDIKESLTHRMRDRHLDRHFQVILTICNGEIEADIKPINIFNKPKECVIWN